MGHTQKLFDAYALCCGFCLCDLSNCIVWLLLLAVTKLTNFDEFCEPSPALCSAVPARGCSSCDITAVVVLLLRKQSPAPAPLFPTCPCGRCTPGSGVMFNLPFVFCGVYGPDKRCEMAGLEQQGPPEVGKATSRCSSVVSQVKDYCSLKLSTQFRIATDPCTIVVTKE